MIRLLPVVLLACSSKGGDSAATPPGPGSSTGTTTPAPEACNGLDDDLDGVVDVGPEGGVCSEVFEVTRKLDLLFLIDDSQGMDPAQVALAGEVGPFLNALADGGIAFHAGAVTTDMSSSLRSGALVEVGAQRWIDDPVQSAVLQDMVQPGSGGSETERGRDAVFEAIEVLAQPAEINDGFKRSDADLSVIVLSTESDFSTGIDMADMHDWLLASETGGSRASFHSLVVPPALCGGTPGDDYLWLTAQIGGVSHPFCDTGTYDQALDAIAAYQRYPTLRDVQLTEDVDPAWLSAVVEPVGVQAIGYAAEDLLYDAATRTVTLPEYAASGSRITVFFGPTN